MLCSVLNSSVGVAAQIIAALLTVFLLYLALKQYKQSIQTIQVRNSLDVLSWFDEEEIAKLLDTIAEESQHKEEVRLDENRVKLLFYLDTAYNLMDKKLIDLRYFRQMHEDFVRISKDADTIETLAGIRDQLPNLDLKKIADLTKPRLK